MKENNMKTEKSPRYYITEGCAIDRYCAVKLADLSYKSESHRPDDFGSLYVAPIVSEWASPGLLALYATTNGDPIRLAQIECGEIEWIEPTDREAGMDDDMREVLSRAQWVHPKSGEGYSYLVMDAVEEMEA